MTPFRAIQIDHAELFVLDRYEAAAWYERILGLEILPEYQYWAKDSGGPLMISSGVTQALWAHNPGVKIVGLEPQESAVLSGRPSGCHKISLPGGKDWMPAT